MKNSEERRQMKKTLLLKNVSFQQSRLLVTVQEICSLDRVSQIEACVSNHESKNILFFFHTFKTLSYCLKVQKYDLALQNTFVLFVVVAVIIIKIKMFLIF